MINRLLLFFSLIGICSLSCSRSQTGESDHKSLDFRVELETVREGYTPDTTWTQAYVGVIAADSTRELAVTMSKRIGKGIDNYGSLYEAKSYDLGQTWSAPALIMKRTTVGSHIEQALGDVFPHWHSETGTLLATGKLFVYDTRRKNDPEVGRKVGYLVYNPEKGTWSTLKTLKMPEKDHSGAAIYNPNAGCGQPYDLSNGDVLLPLYYLRENEPEGQNLSTIVRCSFDDQKLTYKEHGDELTVPIGRGLGETSITKYKGEYFLTLRNDSAAYVTKGTDGLHWQPIKKWKFDDGSMLGSYNTQQHWVTHSDGLYLVYTRRGADNDEIFRNRAPLFIGKVNPKTLQVIRKTERVLVPKRGARLGNFGVANVNDTLTVVSVAERMQSNSTKLGAANNSVFVAQIIWNKPNKLISFR